MKDINEEITENEKLIEKRKNKVKRDIKIIIMLLLILLIMLLFTIGMGYFLVKVHKENITPKPIIDNNGNKKPIPTEIIEAEYDKTSEVNLNDNNIAKNEQEAMTKKPQKVKVTNNGPTDLKYRIVLEKLNSKFNKKDIIPEQAILYKIENSKGTTKTNNFYNIKSNVLYEGTVKAKSKINFKMYVWLEDNGKRDIFNKSYMFRIKIKAGQK